MNIGDYLLKVVNDESTKLQPQVMNELMCDPAVMRDSILDNLPIVVPSPQITIDGYEKYSTNQLHSVH